MAAPVAPWWNDKAAVIRFVSDLLSSELTALRHELVLPQAQWDAGSSLEHDLGLDSLELLHVAGALADTLQMRRAGLEDYLLVRRTLGDWADIVAVSLQVCGDEITFHTSGSTGTPKPCTHALAALEEEAQAIAALLSGRRRVLLAVPSHHIYGFLCGQLLPRHLDGAPPVVSVRHRVPSQLVHAAQPGDLVIGHPQFWQAALAQRPSLSPDVVGLTSTAPCPGSVAAMAGEAGLAGLFELYGSSETAGIGWRARHGDAFELFPYLRRDESGAILRHAGALPVQDALDWSDGRHFRVKARHDGAVQVGGINVFPERVREMLLSHPEVKDAAVRLMREDEGTRLKAFIVPHTQPDDSAAFIRRLRQWADQALSAPERPKAFTVGAELPRGPLGKLADWSAGT